MKQGQNQSPLPIWSKSSPQHQAVFTFGLKASESPDQSLGFPPLLSFSEQSGRSAKTNHWPPAKTHFLHLFFSTELHLESGRSSPEGTCEASADTRLTGAARDMPPWRRHHHVAMHRWRWPRRPQAPSCLEGVVVTVGGGVFRRRFWSVSTLRLLCTQLKALQMFSLAKRLHALYLCYNLCKRSPFTKCMGVPSFGEDHGTLEGSKRPRSRTGGSWWRLWERRLILVYTFV